MLEASGCAATIEASSVPLLDGVLDLAQRDVVAGGTKRNHAWLRPMTDWGELTVPEQLVLADAQTSGGLLLATNAPGDLVRRLTTAEAGAWRIGSITTGAPGHVTVLGRTATT
jgi:selenophosphate synthase